MKNYLINKCAVLAMVVSLGGCFDDGNSGDVSPLNLPATPFNYSNIELPEHYLVNDFPAGFSSLAAIDVEVTPDHNLTTDHGATLGRVLFYDKKLSANGTVACASCHLAEFGFSDPEPLSTGFDGDLTPRHSVGITNVNFYATNKYFRDERATTLEEMVLVPFQDSIEMGLILAELEEIVMNQSYYPELFENAFGDPTISSDRISRALAQFIRSFVSTTSKYDIARQDVASPLDDFPQFTDQENLGKSLFFNGKPTPSGVPASCAACHATEAFVAAVPPFLTPDATIATSIGLVSDDMGVGEISEDDSQMGLFKVQSLRNVAARAHYMHDGRFSTLEEVLEHYSTGITKTDNLSFPLTLFAGDPTGFNFTEEEKAAIIAFLETLTDHEMLADEKFSNPFVEQ